MAILLLMGMATHTNIIGNQNAQKKIVILEGCLQHPTSCVGQPLVMRVQIDHSSDGSFIAYPKIRGVYQLGYPVLLSGNLTMFQHGYAIDILGAYSLDSTFTITKYQRNNWIRTVKYAVSLLGLLLTIILLSRRYRFAPDRMFPLIRR